MICILPGIENHDQYLACLDEHGQIARPKRCLNEACGKQGVWRNGWYERINICMREAVRIFRFLCPHCRRSFSLIPLFMAPRRHYVWRVQQKVLLLLTGLSILKVSTQKRISRHTIRRWRDWLFDRERSAIYCHHLLTRFPELGRHSSAADFSDFWQHCLKTIGLAKAMLCISQAGESVP